MSIKQEWKLMSIPLKDLVVADTNIRKHYTDAELDKLMQSMKAVGQRDAIYAVLKDGKYHVIKGQRRLLAAQKLVQSGKTIGQGFSLMAIVKDIDRADQLIDCLVEDEHQKKVSQLDTSKGVEDLIKEGKNKQEIMDLMGWSEQDFVWALSLLGSTEPETLKERDEENKSSPSQTAKSVKEDLIPSISKIGTIEDPMKGLTSIQRSEAMARQREEKKPLEDVAEEVKDFYSGTREIGGLYMKIHLIDAFNEFAKITGSQSLRHEVEKYINSEETKEYLKKKGIKVVE